jgi:hypothetical protein
MATGKRSKKVSPKRPMKINSKFTIEGTTGTKVEIDVNKIRATPAQKKLVAKLLASGDLGTLSATEKNKIKSLKALVGTGMIDPKALIVRFDWTWVRIDEKIGGRDTWVTR